MTKMGDPGISSKGVLDASHGQTLADTLAAAAFTGLDHHGEPDPSARLLALDGALDGGLCVVGVGDGDNLAARNVKVDFDLS
jgi:hypothetical protein